MAEQRRALDAQRGHHFQSQLGGAFRAVHAVERLGLVRRRRRARCQAVRRAVYGDRAHVRLRRDARKQVPERIRRAVRAVHAHQGVDVFVRARRRRGGGGRKALFVVHADGHAVHLDGDELGVRVRERRGGDEALERFRVRIGEGLHHELVEVLLDLRAPGVEQRPNEVREQIVFRRASNRRSTRTAGRRAARGASRRGARPAPRGRRATRTTRGARCAVHGVKHRAHVGGRARAL